MKFSNFSVLLLLSFTCSVGSSVENKCNRSEAAPFCVGDRVFTMGDVDGVVRIGKDAAASYEQVMYINGYNGRLTVKHLRSGSEIEVSTGQTFLVEGCQNIIERKICVGDSTTSGEIFAFHPTLPLYLTYDSKYGRVMGKLLSQLEFTSGCVRGLCAGDVISARVIDAREIHLIISEQSEVDIKFITYGSSGGNIILGTKVSHYDSLSKPIRITLRLSFEKLADLEVTQYSPGYPKESSVRGLIPMSQRKIVFDAAESLKLMKLIWQVGGFKNKISEQKLNEGVTGRNEATLQQFRCKRIAKKSTCQFLPKSATEVGPDKVITVTGPKATDLFNSLARLAKKVPNAEEDHTVSGITASCHQVIDTLSEPYNAKKIEESTSCWILP